MVTFLSSGFEGFVLLGRWFSIAKACSFEMDVFFDEIWGTQIVKLSFFGSVGPFLLNDFLLFIVHFQSMKFVN